MIPVLFKANAVDFSTYGIGVLADCISCEVTEERNGAYELVLQYPVTGRNYGELSSERIIKAKPNDTADDQAFRIYRITTPIDGVVTVYAQHISYDLSNIAALTWSSESISPALAMQRVFQNTATAHSFTCQTDYSEAKPFSVAKPQSVRACLGGVAGSFLDLWGGEYEWDNFHVIHHQGRGQHTGVVIEYGKNLTELEHDSDITEVYTDLLPYAVISAEDGSETVVTLTEVLLPIADTTLSQRKTLIRDFTDSFGEEERPPKKSRFKNFFKKYKKWMIGAGAAVLVVAIVVCSVSYISYRADPLRGYTQITVANGNVIKTMSCTGSVEPVARYEIKSTVSGSITESPLNAGDTVRAGELVYKVDDTNAQLAVQQAENAVERAQAATQSASSSSSDSVRIYANATGTISDLNIQSGSRLSGGQIATITQADGNEVALTPNITGTVSSVSVREGSRVTSGQLVATVTTDSTGPSREELELDEQGAQIALEAAQQELTKYRIASPVDGTILVKNAKVGDVASADSQDPMMVIADMSRMKFSVEIDEMDIWEIEQGQLVVITAAALPGQTFMGEITNVGGEGNVKGNGITTYNVEVTINDPGKLRSGMNIDARIVLDSASNALTLPDNALYEADGTNALVIARVAGGADEELVVDSSEYPGIFVPDGYQLVRIEYGVSDGINVEIVSGLRAGDEVLYIRDENSPESASDGFNANSVSLPTPTAGADGSADENSLSGGGSDIILPSGGESDPALDALPDTRGSGDESDVSGNESDTSSGDFGLRSTDRYATMEQ